ncbi:MAG: glycosyltransferase family 9 protein [Chloroflexota bacterium]
MAEVTRPRDQAAEIAGRLVAGVQRIAVLRANAIGDFIFGLPALAALRAAYPQAEIVLFGQPWHARFLDGRPGPLDRVVPVPPLPGIYLEDGVQEDPAASEAFFDHWRRAGFDLALQMHGGGRHSNPFVLRLGARLSAGPRTPDAAPLDRCIPYIYFQPEVMRLLEVVGLVGALPLALDPALALTAADLDEACRLVPDDGRPLAVLHPGAGDPRRRWPPERFAAVGDALAAAGARVAVIGASEEAALVRLVIERMRRPALDLFARLSLGGLAGLLSRCRVVVSNDSGPLHLAGAVGAPTVGVYWCGNLVTAGPLSAARRRAAIAWRVHCPQCGANILHADCGHALSFVADVPLPAVLEPALELFYAA